MTTFLDLWGFMAIGCFGVAAFILIIVLISAAVDGPEDAKSGLYLVGVFLLTGIFFPLVPVALVVGMVYGLYRLVMQR